MGFEMSDKPREFWIDPQKHDCLQMVFEKSVDGCIHVQEVLPSKPNKIVQLLQMSHLFQRDENINLTADRDKWRGIAERMAKVLDEWRDLDSAPQDQVIAGLASGEECAMVWSGRRVCMLGPRAGEHGEGWATPYGYGCDPNLPLSDVTKWRPIEVSEALSEYEKECGK